MMGGLSSEREISLKSGRAVLQALKDAGWQVLALEVAQETPEEIRRLVGEACVDVVFVAMHGGFGEDGRLQGILEAMGVAFTGPAAEASRLAMDKIASRRVFERAGLCVPQTRVIRRGERLVSLLHELEYPAVVKPAGQGSSIGVTCITHWRQLSPAILKAFRYDDTVLVEEYIKGREITVSVLDGAALPVVAIVPKKSFFDFQAKYEKGMTDYIVPAPVEAALAERAQQDAVTAYDALGCRHLARVDMILDKDGRPVILELNTVPGMTETSLLPKAARAAGLDFPSLCTKIVEMALHSFSVR